MHVKKRSDLLFWTALLATLLYFSDDANAACDSWTMELDARDAQLQDHVVYGTATDHLPTRTQEWFVFEGQVVSINAWAMRVGNFPEPPSPCTAIVVYDADMVFKDGLGDLPRFDPTQGSQG